ncbi:MAG TPA: ATP-binding protein [Nocardioides sp.]
MGRHVVAVLAVTLAVGVLVVLQGGRAATAQAERAAEANVRTIALGFGLPLGRHDLSSGQEDGDTADDGWRAVLAEVVDPALEEGEVLSVHLWERVDPDAAEGRVVWSTDGGRVGTVAPVGGGEEAWRVGATTVERLADGSASLGPSLPNLYEAYLGVADRSGRVYVLEVYKPVRQYDEIRASLLRDWLPLAVGGVLLVGLVTLPLSLRLARRAGEAEAARALHAERAARARAAERLRIGAALHERAVQDLAAAGLLLDTVRTQVPRGAARDVVDRVAGMLADDVRELRSLVEAEVGREGSVTGGEDLADLASTVEAWATHVGLGADGTTLVVDLPPVALDPMVGTAVVRLLHEALRNVAKHAEATRVEVTGTVVDGVLEVGVSDDGRGFAAEVPRAGHATGLGLAVVQDLVADVGGRMEVSAAEGTGTTVRGSFPTLAPPEA